MVSLAQSLLTGIVIALWAVLTSTFLANRSIFACRIGSLGTAAVADVRLIRI